LKPRVLYWNNIPSPYIVDRFNTIASRQRVDFKAWFDEERESDRSWEVCEAEWNFNATYLRPSALGRALDVHRRLSDLRPELLVTIYGRKSSLAGIGIARSLGIPVVLHALKTFDTWRPNTLPRRLVKRALFRVVNGFQVPGPDSRDYVTSFGANPSKVHVFPEPVRVEHFASVKLDEDQRLLRRAELGLQGCVFLYVGRLWRGKGIDYLMEAFRRLCKENPQVSLLLLGDGIDEARYRAMAADLPGVVFAGFVQEPELPAWYALSDVLLFPTLGDPYGHVVQEAMASSLPVISSENAGDVRERVVEGKTGFVVKAASAEALLGPMRTLAVNPELRSAMGAAGYERIRSRTVEWWAGEFEKMVEAVISQTSRRPGDRFRQELQWQKSPSPGLFRESNVSE
jgi:glycosyltransferase involved in cell wall biosynthesis